VGVRDAAFPAVVALAILGYAVSKPAWLTVEQVNTSDYGQTPLLAISHADVESYASLVEALRKAEEVHMVRSETKKKSLSRINRNEAYKILDFHRNQNADRSSKRFYVEYNGRTYHATLQFQYEKPKLVD
jgi:inorganic pyrophosphatase/exopolyphosphatase